MKAKGGLAARAPHNLKQPKLVGGAFLRLLAFVHESWREFLSHTTAPQEARRRTIRAEALTQIADTHEITEALKRAAKGERRDIIKILAPVAPSAAVRGAVIAATGYGVSALLETADYTWRCRAS